MHYVVIGSGIAGVTFIEKCRQLDSDLELTLITNDNYGYYSRPILSHGFSKENIEQTIVLKNFEQIAQNQIAVISNAEVTGIDRDAAKVKISGLPDIAYDKLIIATGSAAFVPPPYRPYRESFYLFNSLSDLKQLRKIRNALLAQGKKPDWAIIGGGLIGSELASDLALAGDDVTLYHAMDRLMERQLTEHDSATLFKVLQTSGVNIQLEQVISSIDKPDDQSVVNINNQSGQTVHNIAVVSCGFKPRTDLAETCGLEVDRGIKVNAFLQTADPNIFALGDVAQLPDEKLYAFILPIRSQAIWLANYLTGQQTKAWSIPVFKPKAKVHGFEAAHPYIF